MMNRRTFLLLVATLPAVNVRPATVAPRGLTFRPSARQVDFWRESMASARTDDGWRPVSGTVRMRTVVLDA